jgi:wobble nucleotide-excising tRNase
MIERPKPPENRVTCGYCGKTFPKSQYEAHFCARHKKFMEAVTRIGIAVACISIAGLLITAMLRSIP